VVVPLSEDAEALRSQLLPLRTEGGADLPEDVAGGLAKAMDPAVMGWRDASECQRLIVLVADAPPHGRKFAAKPYIDRFPDGPDPDGLEAEEVFRQLAAAKFHFTLTLGSRHLDQTVTVFREVWTATAPAGFEFNVTHLAAGGVAPPVVAGLGADTVGSSGTPVMLPGAALGGDGVAPAAGGSSGDPSGTAGTGSAPAASGGSSSGFFGALMSSIEHSKRR